MDHSRIKMPYLPIIKGEWGDGKAFRDIVQSNIAFHLEKGDTERAMTIYQEYLEIARMHDKLG